MSQISQVLRELAIGILSAGTSIRTVAREFNVNFSTISHFQHRFWKFGSTSNRPHNRRQHVRRHVGERFDDINVVNRVPHGVGGVMVWAGISYKHNWILSMTIWIYRDTVKRSWGPLSYHSSATIISCFSMIMYGAMLQGSVHNSWKVKMSQFFHGLHTHHTCHPLMGMFGCSGSTCTTVCSISRQYPATSHRQWRGVGRNSTGHNQLLEQLCAKVMCRAAWGKWWSHQILTGFLIHTPAFFLRYLWPTDAYVYLQSCQIHRLGPREFI